MLGWHVTARDIQNWTETNKRESEDTLPLLVERLIRASTDPKSIEFGSGDSVSIGGWDGIVDVDIGGEFVPTGKSGWEIGTNKGVKSKADGEFDKRTKNPAPLDPETVSFVFVSSRPWTQKDKWAKGKVSSNWLDVRGINSKDLESWLTHCPAVHRWFAAVVGKRSGDLWDAEQAWDAITRMTKIALTSDLLLTGRQDQRQALHARLNSTATVTRIKAQSHLEAYGFILASLTSSQDLIVRTLVVKNQKTWDWLLDFEQPLILIPDGFKPKAVGSATGKGHHIIIPLDRRDSAKEDILIGQMNRANRISALETMGLSEDAAQSVYEDTKGYFEPMLRHETLGPQDRIEPNWQDQASSSVLFAILFASEWNIDNENDRDVMAKLSGLTYDDFESAVVELSGKSDPPIRLVGRIWQVIAKVDLWLHIAPLLAKKHLDRFQEVFDQTLFDVDPAFALPAGERHMASFNGLEPAYSTKLKSGLADTLALLAAQGGDCAGQTGNYDPPDLVRYWIRDFFEEHGVSAELWYSLGSSLRSISEAAPAEFLTAVEQSMKDDPPQIRDLFLAEDDSLFGGCPQANLLWSLELISWNKSYLCRACACLAQLSDIDPGGRHQNRPFNSLVDILLGWYINTMATHEERLQIIENVLIPIAPQTSWNLMVALLFNNTRTTSRIAKPNYHDWANTDIDTVNPVSYREYVSKIVDLLLANASADPGNRLPNLIENFDSYSKDQSNAVINVLSTIMIESLVNEDRKKIEHSLRGTLSHHREFPNAKWAWPEDLLDKLELAHARYVSDDEIERHLHLFDDHWPTLAKPPKRREIGIEERDQIISTARAEAAAAIYEACGLRGLRGLAESCQMPGLVGLAVAEAEWREDIEAEILSWLGGQDNLEIAAQRFVFSRGSIDAGWANSKLEGSAEWEDSKISSFLLGLVPGKATFDIVSGQSPQIREQYWNGLDHYHLRTEQAEEIIFVTERLLEHSRPLAAIDALAPLLRLAADNFLLQSTLLSKLLIEIARNPADISKMPLQRVRYDILEAIRVIQDQATLAPEEIAKIEWLYLPTFRFEETTPKFLADAVSQDPSLFVQMVLNVFPPKNVEGEIEAVSDDDRHRAEMAWELLDTISTLPGTTDVSIDSTVLGNWVRSSRELLDKAGRLDIGDDRIGAYLARCPNGDDGNWPHEAIRDVIESIRSDSLDSGLVVGKLNLRGTTSRSPFDGGQQERKIAKHYESNAESLELSYPRTAEILRRLANSYRQDANREDQQVNLRE